MTRAVLALALFAVACGGASPPPKPVPTDAEKAFVDAAEALAAATCGCKDGECIVSAIDDGRWDSTFRNSAAGLELTDDGAARYARAHLDAHRCVQAALNPPSTGAADDALAGLIELRRRACACLDPACAEQVQADFVALGEKHKDTKGSDTDVEQFKAEFDLMQACSAVVAQGTTGIPACDLYIQAMETYLACEAVPQETRAAARGGIDAMKQGWGDVSELPHDVLQQTADACISSIQALEDGAAALGCTL